MSQQELYAQLFEYISKQLRCSINDLYSGKTVFIEDDTKKKYVKILSVKDSDIVIVSHDIYDKVKLDFAKKSRDELYESKYIFGQTLHYAPDLWQMKQLPLMEDYSYEILADEDIKNLYGISGFENSLAFDEKGNTPTCIVLYAKKDDEIIALAGASYVSENLQEVGIDVKKAFRGKGLASLLVHNLTVEILKQGNIPFYSASVTNIASQAVAIRSGYMPLWTDTFGVRDI